MKGCPKCQRLYPTDAGFCPIDGSALTAVEQLPVAPDPDDSRIGATLCDGRYEVRRRVADGGMGRVYQARDLRKNRNVAVKVLHPEVADDAVAVERFKREYALSAELPHDHIVEVLDFSRTEDNSYALVMEYLEGEELRHFLKREKTMPVGRLIRMIAQLAVGLKQPHAMDLVHRDIKPDNIFLCGTEQGLRVKLLDFGSVRDNSAGAKKLTLVGTTIGSPYYMSPEQAQGLPELDHRADVWSLATIAYECLTGTVPFPGSTGPQILLAILSKDPPPLAANAPDGSVVPAAVEDVMVEALAKEASARIGSVAQLADRLGAAYGLRGNHRQWADTPEQVLEQQVQLYLATLPPPPSQPAAPDSEVSPSFREDDMLMGVPTQSPMGVYIGIALVVALLLITLLAVVFLL